MHARLSHRLALACLLIIHAAVGCAGFLAPYAVSEQHRAAPFAVPVRVRFFDDRGCFHLRPFIRPEASGPVYSLRFFSGGHLFGVDEPARIFLLGTDDYGRDQFSRLLHGGRVSLLAGWLATLLSLGFGLVFGALAGYWGGWMDALVMRAAELFLALPWLYLLLAVRALLPLSLDPGPAFLLLIGLIGAVGWARPARLIRGVVLSAKERAYVRAAAGFGASHLHIVTRHILPATYGVLLTQAALLVPQYVLAEVTLSFLGLGVGEPLPSWGNMLASLRQVHVLSNYWWMGVSGLVLVPLFLCFHVCTSTFAGASRVR